MENRVESEDLQRGAQRVLRRREQLGLALDDVAGRVGISVEYLRRIEQCQTVPRTLVLIRIGEELGMKMGEMFADGREAA